MAERENSRFKTVGLVIIITLIGKALGLGRGMFIGQTFGTGCEADALLTASHFPRIFFDAVFASAVSASFIPVFNEVLQRKGREEAIRLSNGFFTVVGLVAIALTGLGVVFAPALVEAMANFAPETADLTADLLRIIFPSLFFTAIAFSMVGVLNSFGEFNVPAAMSIASNGIIILYFLFFVGRFGVFGAAVAFLIGWAAQALMQMPSLKKRGYSYRPRIRHPDLKKIFILMLPVMVGTWTQPINMLISIRFASAIPGGISSLEYANGLFIIIAGIFVLSVTNVIFPEMSRLSAAGDRVQFLQMISSTIRTLSFLLIPMTVGLKLLATPLIQLIYERQEFCEVSTELTASALFYLSLGMVGYGVQNVLIRAFFAERKGTIPLISGLVSISVNFVLCTLLVNRMGVSGLALASAASLLATIFVLAPATHKMLGGGLITRELFFSLGKMLFAALLMGFAVFFLRNFLLDVLGSGTVARFVLIGVSALSGLGIYMALARVMGIQEAKFVFSAIGRIRKGDG